MNEEFKSMWDAIRSPHVPENIKQELRAEAHKPKPREPILSRYLYRTSGVLWARPDDYITLKALARLMNTSEASVVRRYGRNDEYSRASIGELKQIAPCPLESVQHISVSKLHFVDISLLDIAGNARYLYAEASCSCGYAGLMTAEELLGAGHNHISTTLPWEWYLVTTSKPHSFK